MTIEPPRVPRTRRWPMAVAAAIALALSASACGEDDGACDYLFNEVPNVNTCGLGRNNNSNPMTDNLQDEFDCGNAVFSGRTDPPEAGPCQLISCQVCADVDSDFDGDFDFDGDVDDDD